MIAFSNATITNPLLCDLAFSFGLPLMFVYGELEETQYASFAHFYANMEKYFSTKLFQHMS